MKRTIQSEDLTKTVICTLEEPVTEVARILRDTRARHLLVLDDNKCPQGIISTTDINNRVVAEEKDPKNLKAQDIMTTSIHCVQMDTEVADVLATMSEHNLSSLPVVDDKKSLLGMIDFSSALQALSQFEKEVKDVAGSTD